MYCVKLSHIRYYKNGMNKTYNYAASLFPYFFGERTNQDQLNAWSIRNRKFGTEKSCLAWEIKAKSYGMWVKIYMNLIPPAVATKISTGSHSYKYSYIYVNASVKTLFYLGIIDIQTHMRKLIQPIVFTSALHAVQGLKCFMLPYSGLRFFFDPFS